jgi:hypothetical protein
MMMQSAEDRPSNELAEPLGRPTARRVLVQRQMRSQFVVIAGIGRKDPAQVGLTEDNDVIEAFPADRADQFSLHARSARVTSGQSDDHVYPWLQDAS